MAHTVISSSVAANYFTTAGVAISASNQPDILGGGVGGYSANTGYLQNTVGLIGAGVGINIATVDVVQTSGTDGAVTLAKPNGTFAYQAAGEYIIFGYSTGVNGVTNNVLRSPASFTADRQAQHTVKSVRTTKVTKAIRNNLWNEVSGIYTSALETSNDFSTFGTDQASNVDGYTHQGLYAFQIGTNVATTGEYNLKT